MPNWHRRKSCERPFFLINVKVKDLSNAVVNLNATSKKPGAFVTHYNETTILSQSYTCLPAIIQSKRMQRLVYESLSTENVLLI